MKRTLMIVFLAAFSALHAADVVKSLVASSLKLKEVDISKVNWEGFDKGFVITPEGPCLDNSVDTQGKRGVGKVLFLNQSEPLPIRVTAESKSVKVGGSPDSAYSIYLDIIYQDGTPQWGITAPFSTGTHDWESKEVFFMPTKPIKHARCWLLLRVPGKVWFRNLKCFSGVSMPKAKTFDSQTIIPRKEYSGWMLRDVKAQSDYLSCQTPQDKVLGINLTFKTETLNGATIVTATLEAPQTKADRILNLTYVETLPEQPWKWLAISREPAKHVTTGQFSESVFYKLGSNGLAGSLPFAAVATDDQGRALGMDLKSPAYGRMFYNAPSRELAVTWDIALTPETPKATVKLLDFSFKPTWGLRSAFAKLYRIYPEEFKVRIKKQGLWMPFAPISEVQGYQDFGFAVKEGHSETQWDDQHGILTFRYTEPMTWWMSLAKGRDWDLESAAQHALNVAKKSNYVPAKTFQSSIFHDENGKPFGLIKDTPWCNGVVWSMNSMPGIEGEFTDFKRKWNPQLKEQLYGPNRKGDLDGEYVDSSEGYVTHVIDYNRAHFRAAKTPLTYSQATLTPGIFRGLIAYEYVKALADDLHPMGKFTMANSTPSRLWFLAPLLDVLGTESNWNSNGSWAPPSDLRLLYIRLLCGKKPFCFLQNTDFDFFPHESVEKYMKRSLFYGMYPGFFSANAATKQYFRNPKLYNRDRKLFLKYVPLCKLVGEAGWEPETNAWSSNPKILVERFGENYFTLLNDSHATETAVIRFNRTTDGATAILGKTANTGNKQELRVTLPAEDVMIIKLK